MTHQMTLAAFQPDLAHNLGSMIRVAACFGAGMEVIEPCGFPLSSRQLKEAALDYGSGDAIMRHDSWEAFAQRHSGSRLVLLTTQANAHLWEFSFAPGDVIVTGRETAGVPADVAAACDARLRIPMASDARSLNVAMAAAIALGEAARQLGAVT